MELGTFLPGSVDGMEIDTSNMSNLSPACQLVLLVLVPEDAKQSPLVMLLTKHGGFRATNPPH